MTQQDALRMALEALNSTGINRGMHGDNQYFDDDLVAKALAACQSALAEQPALATCKSCNGNDGDAPCAYPSEGKHGCLRDARLSLAEQDDGCTRSHPHEDMTEECVIKTDIARLNNHLAHLENHDGVSIQLQISPQTMLSKDISGVSREAGVRIQSFLNQAYEAIDSHYNKAARDKEAAKLHMVEPDYRLIGCAKCGSHDVGGGHKTIYCYGCKDTAQGENLEDATEKWNNKQLASLFIRPAPKTYNEHDIDVAIGVVEWDKLNLFATAEAVKQIVMRFAGSQVTMEPKRLSEEEVAEIMDNNGAGWWTKHNLEFDYHGFANALMDKMTGGGK